MKAPRARFPGEAGRSASVPRVWAALPLALLALQLVLPASARRIIIIRHAEGPDVDNTQYRFSADDDLDPVGYLRSICVVSVFGKNHSFPLQPTFLIAQNPRHSRRSPETILPLAAHLHLPIDSCCHKDQLDELSDRLERLEPWYDPVLVTWWGRVMPNITLLLGIPEETTPRWPNHWSGSDAIWLVDTVSRTLETYRMLCDPVAEMDDYCFRSEYMPAIPRPDWGPWVAPDDPDNGTAPGERQRKGLPVVRVEKLLADGTVMDVTRKHDGLPGAGAAQDTPLLADEEHLFDDDLIADPPVSMLDAGFKPVPDHLLDDERPKKPAVAKFDKDHGGWTSHYVTTKRYLSPADNGTRCGDMVGLPLGYGNADLLAIATVTAVIVSLIHYVLGAGSCGRKRDRGLEIMRDEMRLI
ncbi:hypothetical protein DFJ74DRAFT_336528 [Hyaloraphidium curvatum]|nr:hypothetical protein DFJ74DRAFT_336528 [Hyaloraphidium curvatum]